MKRWSVLAALSLAGGATAGPAQVEETTVVADAAEPSLGLYLDEALERHPAVVAARERVTAAAAGTPQATTLPAPVLRYTWLPRPLETRTGPQRHRLGVSQTLPWFGVLERRGEATSAEVERARAALAVLQVETQRRVKNAYAEYAWLGEERRVTRANLELLMQTEPLVQRKIQGGASQADLLRLQMEIGRIEDRLASLERRARVLSAELAAAVGRDPRESLPPPPFVMPERRELDLDAVRARVVESNRELAVLDRELARERARGRALEIDDRPMISLSFDWFETGEARTPEVPGSGRDPIAIGAAVSLPIWRPGYDAAVDESLARSEEALARRADWLNRLSVETERVYYELDDAARRLDLYRDVLIPRADQTLALTRRAYQADAATILDWLDAERELLEFDRALHRVATDYQQRLADLEALCGGTLE